MNKKVGDHLVTGDEMGRGSKTNFPPLRSSAAIGEPRYAVVVDGREDNIVAGRSAAPIRGRNDSSVDLEAQTLNVIDTVCDNAKERLRGLVCYRVKGFPVGPICIFLLFLVFCSTVAQFIQLVFMSFLELFILAMALFKVLLKILANAFKSLQS